MKKTLILSNPNDEKKNLSELELLEKIEKELMCSYEKYTIHKYRKCIAIIIMLVCIVCMLQFKDKIIFELCWMFESDIQGYKTQFVNISYWLICVYLLMHMIRVVINFFKASKLKDFILSCRIVKVEMNSVARGSTSKDIYGNNAHKIVESLNSIKENASKYLYQEITFIDVIVMMLYWISSAFWCISYAMIIGQSFVDNMCYNFDLYMYDIYIFNGYALDIYMIMLCVYLLLALTMYVLGNVLPLLLKIRYGLITYALSLLSVVFACLELFIVACYIKYFLVVLAIVVMIVSVYIADRYYSKDDE